MPKSQWLILVKAKYQEVKKEGKLKGLEAMKEAIKRAKLVYKKPAA